MSNTSQESVFTLEVFVQDVYDAFLHVSDSSVARSVPLDVSEGTDVFLDDVAHFLDSMDARQRASELDAKAQLRAVGIRFLDFPLQLILPPRLPSADGAGPADPSGSVLDQETAHQLRELGLVPFRGGKSCAFSAPLPAIEARLQRSPLFLLYLDISNRRHPRLLGTAAVELAVFHSDRLPSPDYVPSMNTAGPGAGASGELRAAAAKHGWTMDSFSLFDALGQRVGSIASVARLVFHEKGIARHLRRDAFPGPAPSQPENNNNNSTQNNNSSTASARAAGLAHLLQRRDARFESAKRGSNSPPSGTSIPAGSTAIHIPERDLMAAEENRHRGGGAVHFDGFQVLGAGNAASTDGYGGPRRPETAPASSLQAPTGPEAYNPQQTQQVQHPAASFRTHLGVTPAGVAHLQILAARRDTQYARPQASALLYHADAHAAPPRNALSIGGGVVPALLPFPVPIGYPPPGGFGGPHPMGYGGMGPYLGMGMGMGPMTMQAPMTMWPFGAAYGHPQSQPMEMQAEPGTPPSTPPPRPAAAKASRLPTPRGPTPTPKGRTPLRRPAPTPAPAATTPAPAPAPAPAQPQTMVLPVPFPYPPPGASHFLWSAPFGGAPPAPAALEIPGRRVQPPQEVLVEQDALDRAVAKEGRSLRQMLAEGLARELASLCSVEGEIRLRPSAALLKAAQKRLDRSDRAKRSDAKRRRKGRAVDSSVSEPESGSATDTASASSSEASESESDAPPRPVRRSRAKGRGGDRENSDTAAAEVGAPTARMAIHRPAPLVVLEQIPKEILQAQANLAALKARRAKEKERERPRDSESRERERAGEASAAPPRGRVERHASVTRLIEVRSSPRPSAGSALIFEDSPRGVKLVPRMDEAQAQARARDSRSPELSPSRFSPGMRGSLNAANSLNSVSGLEGRTPSASSMQLDRRLLGGDYYAQTPTPRPDAPERRSTGRSHSTLGRTQHTDVVYESDFEEVLETGLATGTSLATSLGRSPRVTGDLSTAWTHPPIDESSILTPGPMRKSGGSRPLALSRTTTGTRTSGHVPLSVETDDSISSGSSRGVGPAPSLRAAAAPASAAAAAVTLGSLLEKKASDDLSIPSSGALSYSDDSFEEDMPSSSRVESTQVSRIQAGVADSNSFSAYPAFSLPAFEGRGARDAKSGGGARTLSQALGGGTTTAAARGPLTGTALLTPSSGGPSYARAPVSNNNTSSFSGFVMPGAVASSRNLASGLGVQYPGGALQAQREYTPAGPAGSGFMMPSGRGMMGGSGAANRYGEAAPVSAAGPFVPGGGGVMQLNAGPSSRQLGTGLGNVTRSIR